MAFKRQNSKIDAFQVAHSSNIEVKSPIEKLEIESTKHINTKDGIDTKTIKIILPHGNKKRKDTTATSIRINQKAMSIMLKKIEENNTNLNAVINSFLEQIYNKDTKDFKINISKKEIQKTETIPTTIATEIARSLKTEASYRNMSIGEFFSALFIEAFK